MTIDVQKLRLRATITLECEPEELPIEGNCSAIDPVTDKATADWIRSELEAGNQWAWCSVTVTASYLGISESDHLGACSYVDENDFTSPGGYYDDMVNEALMRLAERLNTIKTGADGLQKAH